MTRTAPLPALLALLALAACDDAGSSTAAVDTASDVDAAMEETPAGSLLLQLTWGPVPDSPGPRGPLRALVVSTAGDYREVFELSQPGEAARATHILEGVPPGRYAITVFHDRDDDGVHDRCPFPPEPVHTERADQLDNLYGTAETVMSEESNVDVRIERHICGPGESSTGLSGRVAAPVPLDAPIFLLLEPLDSARPAEEPDPDAAGAAGASMARAQTMKTPEPVGVHVPLFPSGLDGEGAFEIGELVPGRYRAIFYADDDGSRTPLFCGPGLGGADRFGTTIDEIIVQPGTRRDLGFVVQLDPAPECDEVAAPLTARLELNEALARTLAEHPELARDADRLAGALRVAAMPIGETDAMRQGARLLPSITARPLPHAVTLTGLEPGLWRLTFYLDRDQDAEPTLCGGLPGGLDRVYATLEDVRVKTRDEIEQVDLGTVTLAEVGECDEAPESGLVGALQLPVGDGPEWSGRPVRLELLPRSDEGERRGFVLFENHQEALAGAERPGEPRRFTVVADIPPGTYDARVFLDTDRDGVFASCEDAEFADRASSPPFEVTIDEGEVTDIGPVEIPSLACEPPAVTVAPRLRVTDDVRALTESGAPLRVQLTEEGGWQSDIALAVETEMDEALVGEALSLVPGRYVLDVYLDTTGDARLTGCEEAEPDRLVGRVELTLGAENPHAEPSIELGPACRP